MPSADKLVAIFTEAKARSAGPERDQFLAEACGADAQLKEQVVSLLEADSEEGRAGFLKNEIARPVAPLAESTGGKIGHYKLLQQLGEGGCGVVYMAEQEEPVRRRVALKVIKLGMDTKSVIARFEAERQALALMEHPNIAKVLDAGATEMGRPFFVMELVRGIKITDYCDQNNLTTGQRLELFTQVCHAVQHAHQKGIIHRDLKPSNILVTLHDGVPIPKVIDFGVAKATSDQRLSDKTAFTAFEQFIGTPAYMSPEQAEMSGLDVDTRSDIYSLGVLLYELLTSRTPLDPEELLRSGMNEMRRKICETESPRPSTRLSTMQAADLTTIAKHRQADAPRLLHLLRGDLDWIVMKALEKDRTRRYETANGLAMDVQRHLKNEPVIARPPSNLYRLQKLIQRNRLSFAAAGAVTIATLLALVNLVASNLRITRESKAKIAALSAAQASEQRAKEQLFLSLRSQAQARRYSRQMGQRLDSLAAVIEAVRIRADPTLRDDAIAALALSDVRRGPKLPVWGTNCVTFECDSTYRRYAVLDLQGGLTVRNIADAQEIQRLDIGAVNADPAVLLFSPDSRFLIKLQEGQTSQAWLLETGEAIFQVAPESGSKGVRAPSFSSDSRLVALADGNFVRCYNLATGMELNRWRTAGRVHSLQFNPRDRRLAVGYVDQPRVSIYDVTDGRETANLPIGSNVNATVRWHPEGNRLAVGGSDPRIQIWDVEARRKVATLEGHAQQVDHLTFHPGGMLLASGSWDGVVRLWDLATARQAMQIPLSANLHFSEDGRWLGFFWASEEHAQLLEFTPALEYSTLESNSGSDRPPGYFCAPSPDGRLLAVAMGDGVRLWDLSARREVALVPGFTASVVFEADGRALLTCSEREGLLQWPIYQSATNAAELLVGPPRHIEVPFTPLRISRSRDGRTLAIVSETAGKAAVLSPETESAHSLVVQHPQASFLALSPDAKWLATSGWHSDRVRLWNTQSGELVREWVVGRQTRVSFTPDSRQLIFGRGSEFSFLDVSTLEISRRLRREIGLYPGEVVFSPDGKLMAMEMSPGVIYLKEVSTGRTVAQLEDPHGDRSNALAFSPDGTQLIVVATWASSVHLWDLRALRARLKPMGLDWDWPEFPPRGKSEESRTSLARAPLKVQVTSTDAR